LLDKRPLKSGPELFILILPGSAICIGTGTTVAAVAIHGELRSIDAIDLAPVVFDFAPYFVAINKRFYAAISTASGGPWPRKHQRGGKSLNRCAHAMPSPASPVARPTRSERT
jgi:hypothetical protein